MTIAADAADGTTAKDLELAARLAAAQSGVLVPPRSLRAVQSRGRESRRALDSFHRAIALDPHYPEVWLDLATSYELDGNTEATRDALPTRQESYPASAEVSWRYGNLPSPRAGDLPRALLKNSIARLQADPQRAAAAFSRAYRADPNIDDILSKGPTRPKRMFTSTSSRKPGAPINWP